MKTFLTLLTFFLATAALNAQAPQQFSFQGVARNAEGKAISNTLVGIRITIHSDAIGGTTVYRETHSAQTNSSGIFTIAVGAGTVQTGKFEEISWKALSHFLQVELDPAGSNTFVDVGTTQLLSVPYALQAKESRQWNDGFPIVQKMTFGAEIDLNDPNPDLNDPKFLKYRLPTIGEGQRFIWYPFKAAFRAGNAGGGKWEDSKIGNSSFASGDNTEASGNASSAMGVFTKALGSYSMSIGYNTEASGESSIASGFNARAKGYTSAAFGFNTYANAKASFTLGSYNNGSDNPNPLTEQSEDRIFQIGNGSADGRQNALTLLRNGNLGLGKTALEPIRKLEVDGRVRIYHSTETAGIHFDNSQHVERGFVGMKEDNQLGFYINGWQLWVDHTGNGYLKGNIALTSDLRLKRDLSPLSASLYKVNKLKGYQYYWKDADRDQSIQTGLMAQDVEKLFPELVKTDDKGFKSVNYIGLIPHLIESVKELSKQNEMLQSSNKEFKEQNAMIMSKLEAMAAQLNEPSRNPGQPLGSTK